MPKRSSKRRPVDPNALAAQIVAESTSDAPADDDVGAAKAAARLLASLGGKKAGIR